MTRKLEEGMKRLEEKLCDIVKKENVILNKDMSKEVSFKVGGMADAFVVPENLDELCNIIKLLREEDVEYFVMGNGSNFIITDKGYHGVIVKISPKYFGEIKMIKFDDECEIEVEAGILMSTLSRELVKESVAGFEFASGIPGTIGGAVFMNAGAYGGEMQDIVQSVKVIDERGDTKVISASEMEFSYRNSRLQRTKEIVISVKMLLKRGNREEIKRKIAQLTKKRNEKQPVNFPSAGSFFKRPAGYYAGTLIQEAGLKGMTVGRAQVSELHGGFIINLGGATATDVLQLRDICKDEVMKKFGVKLETEIRILGDE